MSSIDVHVQELTLPKLQPAYWKHECLGAIGALELCQRASEMVGAAWQGIAYTTCGAVDVRSVSEAGAASSGGKQPDLSTVYELRLWRVDCGAAGAGPEGLIAHELRWINGTGAAEIRVLTSGDAESTCFWRKNEYLLHGQPVDGSATLASVEVFTRGEYGNVTFADELMTGKWV